jgi:cell division protein FtsQ
MSMGFAVAVIAAVSVGLLAGYRWLTTVNYFDLPASNPGHEPVAEDHVAPWPRSPWATT